MIWHPHIWKEEGGTTFYHGRGRIPLGDRYIDCTDGGPAKQVLFAVADLFAGGLYKSTLDDASQVDEVYFERCRICGELRAVDACRFITSRDRVIAGEQLDDLIDIIIQRFGGIRYNAVLVACGMPMKVVGDRASTKNDPHNHGVYTGPL